MHYISKIDLFQLPIHLFVNSKKKRSSILGSIISIGIYLFLIFFFFRSNMYLKQSPYIISQTIRGITTNPINITENDYISFYVTDVLGKMYYDPSIFTVEIRKFAQKRENGTITTISILRETLGLCVYLNLTNNSLCMKNRTLILSGYVDQLEYSYFTVNLLLCDNKTSNGTCKSSEEITKYFAVQKLFNVAIHNAEIDVNDFENPINSLNSAQFFLIDQKLTKRNNLFLKKIEVFSYNGWIVDDLKYYNDFKIDYVTFDFATRVEGQPLYQFLFFASFNHDLVERRYQKLPEFLGSFSGTTQIIIFFGFIFTNISIYVQSLRNVLNSLYVFPNFESKKKKKKSFFNVKFNFKSKKKTQKKNSNNVILSSSNRETYNEQKKKISCENNNDNIDSKIIEKKINLGENTFKNFENLKIENEKIQNVQLTKTDNDLNIEKINIKNLKDDSFFLDHYSEKKIKSMNEIKINDDNNKFTFSMDKNKETEMKNSLSKNEKFNMGSNSIKFDSSKFSPKTNKKEIFEEIDKKKHLPTLKLGFLEFLKYKFYSFLHFKKDDRQKLIEKAEKIYIEELDIVNILAKVQEIEKIKLLIMDDQQLALFNLLDKPMCCIDFEKIQKLASINTNIYLSQRLKTSKSIKNKEYLSVCYEKILENSKVNEFSKRLIHLVDKNIIEMKE